MKILFISAEPIRPRLASETHVNEIVGGLVALGHEVTLCSAAVSGPYAGTSLLRRCLAYVRFWVHSLPRINRSTIIYARAHPANFPIALFAWLRRLRIIHEVNGTYYDVALTHQWLSRFMPLIVFLYRFQFRTATALTTVTTGLSDWIGEVAPGVPVTTIPNGANCDIFIPSRPPVKPVERDYALFFGSLTRWHGVESMIAAAEDPAWPSDLDLVIVGEGQLSEIIQQASERNPRIHALATVSQETLSGYITGAAVGLVPINGLGGRGAFGLSPLKLYEMLACALPVIVTDFPGQSELVRSLGAGVVIPPDDPPALAKAVAVLRKAPPSRDTMLRAASIIKTQHSWKSRVSDLAKLLTQIADNGVPH
jgi:glycosyltransferase involved in cell wall biosynthesis